MSDALFIGLMSGTSMDAVDVALVRIGDAETGDDRLAVLGYRQFPIEPALKARVRALHGGSQVNELTECDALLGQLFADATLRLLEAENTPMRRVAAIGSHGQTVLHRPDSRSPRSLQIGDPNIIAHRTGITTVADFRRKDLAAGGQGAPLAPAFHAAQFRCRGRERVIVNLGGIANLSWLPADFERPIIGFDSGPGNGLLDDWNRRHQSTEMDRDGQWAASGRVHARLLERLLADDFFALPPPKSTGRDYFNLAWLERALAGVGAELAPADVQATLLALTVCSIAAAIGRCAAGPNLEVFLCGGGVHNRHLVAQLKQQLPHAAIADTGALGIDPDAVEAVTFAWLARQTLARRAVPVAEITGADGAQVLGGVYYAG